MTQFFRQIHRLRRAHKGAVLIELAATVVILAAIFIGTAVIGAKTIDFDRDARAARAGADLAYILDTDSSAPAQSDFDIIGQKMLISAHVEPSEDFQVYFTAVEFDHTGAGLQIDWQGSFGTSPELASKVSLVGGNLVVNGYDLTVLDDERLIIVEFYRTRRGLVVDKGKPIYSYAISYKEDLVHA